MFANLEAFLALCSFGTMTAASSHLRITQSAISKRIAHLESHVGKKLIEKVGNKVRLTSAGHHLRAHLRPLFTELKEVLLAEISESSGHIAIAITESMLLSWAARALHEVQQELPEIKLEIFSDRSTLVVESVRSGESLVAICPGEAENTPDLQALKLGHEQVVIVPNKLKTFRLSNKKSLQAITVHRQHEVSNFIWRGISRSNRRWDTDIQIVKTFNTFAMVAEMSMAGFGHGLVTRQLALRMGVPKNKMMELPDPGIQVPISLVGRPTTLARSSVQAFYQCLREHIPKEIA